MRLFIALLSLSLTGALAGFFFGGLELMFFIFIGFYVSALFDALTIFPLLWISVAVALGTFIFMYRANAPKRKLYAVLTGVVPALVFVCVSEAMTFSAMQLSLFRTGEEVCIFDAQSLSISALDVLDHQSIYGENQRYNGHAHVALSGERVLTWSYADVSFGAVEDDEYIRLRLPEKCETLYYSAQSSD